MTIVHFTNDLMMGSQLGQLVRQRGGRVHMIARMDQLVEALDVGVELLIVDLQAPSWSTAEFAASPAARSKTLRVVAYAQHVFPELLEEARRAGIEQVHTRGQFSATLGQLLGV